MGTPKLIDSKKKVQQLNLKGWLRFQLNEQDLSMRKLSRMMGMNDNFLQSRIQAGDFKGAELVLLGNYLNANPFEPYLHLLNAQARPTKTETTQRQQIAELEEKISALEKERDWLKEVVMRK